MLGCKTEAGIAVQSSPSCLWSVFASTVAAATAAARFLKIGLSSSTHDVSEVGLNSFFSFVGLDTGACKLDILAFFMPRSSTGEPCLSLSCISDLGLEGLDPLCGTAGLLEADLGFSPML